jgi:hypothetical protein
MAPSATCGSQRRSLKPPGPSTSPTISTLIPIWGLGRNVELFSGNTPRVPGLTTHCFYPVGGAGINDELSAAMTLRAELGLAGYPRAGIVFALWRSR